MAVERNRPYRGGDRRNAGGMGPGLEAFALAAALLLAVVFAVGLVAAQHPIISAERLAGLSQVAETLSAAFAVGAFLQCLVRWRTSGEALALWVAAAALTFGVVVIGVAELTLPLVAEPRQLRAIVPATYASGLLGTIVLLLVGMASPVTNARLRVWRVGVATLALVGLAAVGIDHAGPIRDFLTAFHPVSVKPGFRVAARAVLSVPWAVLGIGLVVRGLVMRRTLMAWTGLAVSSLALGELAGALQDSAGDLWIPSGHFLRAIGLLLLMIGCSRDLERSYVDQRGRLFDSQLAVRTAETRERVRRTGQRRREHDLRGSLMAIEGAALTLERHNDLLSPEARGKLTTMLAAEIDRLRKATHEPANAIRPFTLADALDNALRAEKLDVEPDLGDAAKTVVIGSPAETIEVIRQMVAAAASEASAGTIALTCREEDLLAFVELRFRPSGFPFHERRAVLTRRLDGADDDGLGLHVAGRLARDQGGDLALVESEGELCFQLRLPVNQAP